MTIYKNKGSEFQQNKEKLNNLIPQKTHHRPTTHLEARCQFPPGIGFLLYFVFWAADFLFRGFVDEG